MSYQVLERDHFPKGKFFDHVQKGIEHYQGGHFQRAIWEWFAASRLNADEPVQLERAADGRIHLRSNLRDVPLLFVFYAIYLNNLSGIGQLTNGKTKQELVFKNGLLSFLENVRREKRLGNYVLEKKRYLSYEQLDAYIRESRQQGKRVGEYLVEKKLLTPQELEDILAQQILEAVSESFFNREGEVTFSEKTIAEKPVVTYSPLKMAFKAAQRRFDVDNFRKEVSDNKAIFRTTPYLGDLEEKLRGRLNTNELFVLSLIDGFRNIDQLIRFSGANEESILSILYRLSKIGLIRKTKESGEYEDKEYEEISRILDLIFDIYTMMFSKLYSELGRKGQEIVDDAKAELNLGHQKLFEGIPLDNPQAIEKQAVLNNMATYFPKPEQRFIFIEIFGDLLTNIIRRSKRFLGDRLTKATMAEVGRIKADVESFSVKTTYTERMMAVLGDLIRRFG